MTDVLATLHKWLAGWVDDQGVKLIHSDSDHKSMLWNHHIICSLSLTTLRSGFTEINYVMDIY